MNLLCKLGIHKYRQIECVCHWELENKIRREFMSCPICFIKEVETRVYAKKVCLRCGKKVDEITPAAKEFRRKFKIDMIEIEKARSLWRNSN